MNTLTNHKLEKSGIQKPTLGQRIRHWEDPFETRSMWYEVVCWSANTSVRLKWPVSAKEHEGSFSSALHLLTELLGL